MFFWLIDDVNLWSVAKASSLKEKDFIFCLFLKKCPAEVEVNWIFGGVDGVNVKLTCLCSVTASECIGGALCLFYI